MSQDLNHWIEGGCENEEREYEKKGKKEELAGTVRDDLTVLLKMPQGNQ